LTQLYWQGFQAIRQDTSISDHLESYPAPYQTLLTAQQAIGWDQLYYSRISVQWACQVTHNSNYTLNGNQFYAKATGLVWHYIMECWQLQNQALHNPQEIPLRAQVLAAQVHQIIEAIRSHPELEHILLAQPAESILQRPIRKLQQWVQCIHTQFNNCLAAAQQQAALHTLNIQTFFCPMQANDLRPP